MSMEKYYREFGKFLGYPSCCVEYFIQCSNYNTRPITKHHRGHPLMGTGFVPCPVCVDKPVQDVVEYIHSHRKYHLPFPREDDDIDEIGDLIWQDCQSES